METNGDVSFIWMLTAVAVFILLIACMNFTNLAVVRSITRSREIGMRKVAGATRGQIVRQFLGETILLSAVAFLVALAAVWVILPVFPIHDGPRAIHAFTGIVVHPGRHGHRHRSRSPRRGLSRPATIPDQSLGDLQGSFGNWAR